MSCFKTALDNLREEKWVKSGKGAQIVKFAVGHSGFIDYWSRCVQRYDDVTRNGVSRNSSQEVKLKILGP